MKEPEFLPGRQASITYKGQRVGIFGIVHPEVLQSFVESHAKSYGIMIWVFAIF